MKRVPMGARFYWVKFEKLMERAPMDARFYWLKFQKTNGKHMGPITNKNGEQSHTPRAKYIPEGQIYQN
jgi:hypothetical protein